MSIAHSIGLKLTEDNRDEIEIKLGSDIISILLSRIFGKHIHSVVTFLVCFTIGWIIPAILSALSGHFMPGEQIQIRCFAFDITMYGFYFLVIPLILFSQNHLSNVLSSALQFAHSSKILQISFQDLQRCLSFTNRWGNHWSVHVISWVASLLSSIWWLWLVAESGHSSWHVSVFETNSFPTVAGWYVGFLSVPLGLYFIYIWTLRAALWTLLLRNLAGHHWHINPLHPDGAGGLAFLSKTSAAWGFLILAVGFVIVLDFTNFVRIHNSSPFRPDLVAKLGAYILLSPAFFLGQLFFFTPLLKSAKHNYLKKLRVFSLNYSDVLSAKLNNSKNYKDLSSSNDLREHITGIVELKYIFDRVKSMRILPFDFGTMVRFLFTVVTPLSPLLVPVLSRAFISLFTFLGT